MFCFKYPFDTVDKKEHINIMLNIRTELCNFVKQGKICPIKETSQKKLDGSLVYFNYIILA